jgi:hypothetical protein
MTAKIDGVTWNATVISEPIRLNGPAGTTLTLSGTDLVTTVTISVSPFNSTGTYNVGRAVATNVSLQDRQGIFVANNLKGSGSITFATISPASASSFAAKGSFSSTVVGTGPSPTNRSITGGSFDITY